LFFSNLNVFKSGFQINEFLLIDRFGCNLLLHACNQNLNADTLAVISLLLEVGADPNSKNNDGDSSLHRMAQLMESQFNLNSHHLPIAHLLLEYGAHFDQVNKLQQTPLDYWKWRHGKIKGKNYSPPEWMSIVPSLACWCARTIRRSKAPYDHLPENLLNLFRCINMIFFSFLFIYSAYSFLPILPRRNNWI